MVSQNVRGVMVGFAKNHLQFAILLMLPLNALYRLYEALWEIGTEFFAQKPSVKTHERKVQRVQKAVKKWREDGCKKKMCTGRAKAESLMYRLPGYRDTLHNIKVDDLKDILSIDVDKRIVKVEPMVNMGQLSKILIPLGWTIPVLPELEVLTVGGLVMGGGIESSSHKYGLFHLTCQSYQIVLSSGEVVVCTKDSYSDLFDAIPFSCGTLGFLTAVEIKLIPAQGFVQLEYYPTNSLKSGLALLEKHSKDTSNNDFVEGIIFDRNNWVVTVGKMVSKTQVESSKIKEFTRWCSPWFYKHVESFLQKGQRGTDYIPLRDYYHRHTRCAFWVTAPSMPYGNNPIFRHLLGWLLPLNFPFLKHLFPEILADTDTLLQDFLVPVEGVSEIVNVSEKVTGLYPMWACPVLIPGNENTLCQSGRKEDTLYYDIGVYGKPEIPDFDIKSATLQLEAVTLKNKGMQAMYTDTYVTESEFREMFNLKHYDVMRKKYDAEKAFPDVYSKTSMKGRIQGL